MKEPISELELIQMTISDLRDGLHELEEKREMLDWEISQKQERLQAWRSKLATLSGEPQTEPRKRAPRGANLKTILTLLQDPASPRQGLTCSDIVAKTNLQFSSVQAALKQGAELFEQVDGFWRPRLDANATAPAGMEANGKVN